MDNVLQMNIALVIFTALFGMAIGSFLNVLMDRIPSGKSIIYPPSHCDTCGNRLSIRDLVPVFSYLWQRGRCRFCQARIPGRTFWVEVGTGFLFAASYYYCGLNISFFLIIFYGCLFMLLGIIDLEHKLILNKIVYPSLAVALIIDVFMQKPGFVNGMIGGVTGFSVLLVLALATRGGMGFGDVKMAALIGVVTGFPLVLVSLFIGIVLGGLIAVLLLLFKIKKRKEFIPFGPFLSIATILTLVSGDSILNWYLNLLT